MSAPDLPPLGPPALPAVLLDPVGAVARRWRPMAAVLLLGTLLCGLIWLRSEARYSAEAIVWVSGAQVSGALVEPALRDDALTRLDAVAAEVLSRQNLTNLIEEFGLYPGARDQLASGELLDRMRADVAIRPAKAVGGEAGDASARAYAIGFQAPDAQAAAGVANGLARLFVATSLADRQRQHLLTIEFLRKQLAEAERELDEQDRAIAGFKRENAGLLPGDLEASRDRRQLLEAQRQSLILQVAAARTQVATLLREQLTRLRTTRTEQHPDVVETRRQIDELEHPRSGGAASRPSASSARQSADPALAFLLPQLAATERELAELDAQRERMPAVQDQLASLEGKALVLREHYQDSLRKLKEAERSVDLLLAQRGDGMSVLSAAEPPAHPARARGTHAGIAFLATLLLCVGLGLVLELLDPVVLLPAQLEWEISAPVLGSVARIR